MPIISSEPIVPTDFERAMAREAMVEGFNACTRYKRFMGGDAGPDCDCEPGTIDGCKIRVEAIAKAIAAARRM